MKQIDTLATAVLVSVLCSLAGAQEPAVPVIGAGDLFVPLHTHAADASYGVWAGGADWKARFDGGFRFFPMLGREAPHNMPWSFQVKGVRQGDGFAAATSDRGTFSGTRFAREHGAFSEVYEVRADGVEQSFVVKSALGRGDLVIEAQVSSELSAEAVEWRHGALDFRDPAGREVLRYGEAFAFDAAGDRIAIETAWDAGSLRLRVPQSFVANAQWPITIDPLTSTTTIMSFITDVRTIGVARARQYNELCVAFTRWFAVDDHDLYVRTTSDSFSGTQTVYTDFANDRDTEHVGLDYVAGAGRYVVAFDVQSGNTSFIRLHFHQGGAGNTQPGTDVDYDPAGIHARRTPAFGGCADGQTTGYLVFRRDPKVLGPNSESSRVYGALVDASAMTVGTASDLHTSAGTNFDAEWPCVSRESRFGNGWMVVWQEYNFDNSNDDWDVIGQRIASDGSLLGTDVFGPDTDPSLHKMRPKVAGTGSQFMVAFTTAANSGTKPSDGAGDSVRAQRFNWYTASSLATIVTSSRVVESGASGSIVVGNEAGTLSFDYEMLSHWVLSWSHLGVAQKLARLGYDARIAELVTQRVESASAHDFHAATCYDAEANRFVAISSANGGFSIVEGRHFLYQGADARPYGVGCVGVLGFESTGTPWLPHAGLAYGYLRISNAPPNATTWLMLSTGAATVPQQLPLSFAGCVLNLDASALLVEYAHAVIPPTGTWVFNVSIPSTLHNDNFYWQCIHFDSVNLSSSNAVVTEVR